MNKKFFAILSAFLICGSIFAFAQTAPKSSDLSDAQQTEAVEESTGQSADKVNWGSAIKYLAAAMAVGIACIGGGSAVAKIGSAAMGAMSENPELSGKALPFVGLAEGICLWGFLVALFIIIM